MAPLIRAKAIIPLGTMRVDGTNDTPDYNCLSMAKKMTFISSLIGFKSNRVANARKFPARICNLYFLFVVLVIIVRGLKK